MAVLVLLLPGLLALPAGATPICRWVDAAGRHQIADVVPPEYRQVAVCTDSQKYELAPGPQREADDLAAAQERARVAGDAAKPASRPTIRPAKPGGRAVAAAASRPVAKRPAELVTERTDCPTWWRLFDESAACFGPFRTTRGAIKVEAFDVCNVVASPEPKCGPRSN